MNQENSHSGTIRNLTIPTNAGMHTIFAETMDEYRLQLTPRLSRSALDIVMETNEDPYRAATARESVSYRH